MKATVPSLSLSPILAVVTNLDREHMDCYGNMHDVEECFLRFLDKVPFYGAVTACVDNPLLAAILPRVHRRVFTYGLNPHADYRLEIVETGLGAGHGQFARFQVNTSAGPLGPFELMVPGRHNVLNATAAVAIGHQLQLAPEKIAEGLNHFRGVDRRFQLRGKRRGVTVVDDYGHHPHRDSRHAGSSARVRPIGGFTWFSSPTVIRGHSTCLKSSEPLSWTPTLSSFCPSMPPARSPSRA